MIFEADNITVFKQKSLRWASAFNVCCYLDSNQFKDQYSKFDALIAVGVRDEVTAQAGQAFDALHNFRNKNPDWITGFLGYDLKNEIEHLTSKNSDYLHFPDLYFFAPQHLLMIKDNQVQINTQNAEAVWRDINQQELIQDNIALDIHLQSRFSKQEYLDAFAQIKQYINRGDIYVTNFCQEFYAEGANINPLQLFTALHHLSPNPFTCFFKHYQQYILCASPERFLAKREHQLISQPIKGTAKRCATSEEDQRIINCLRNSIKEQQENVMIVDLVRNDLTKSAQPGSVKVEELFGIYSFRQVHQMISTVTCTLQDNIPAVEVLKNTFPMGSMTGAPKLKAMQLMEQQERTRRGIYSGTIGYFAPDDDFDFNVVIRSLLYNEANRYLSFQVGSAITHDAVAEQEYDECLLKAKAILQVLNAQI
ncbi:anthranilate synthase component I family protein [Mucilaginibacter robiniae]|uniref:Anthranilate synthase component I family protein n=1 Tax=Mucilaginibacter robiniae TaxID=2728022 RepID=A0A7L5DVP6_9SPHI|nr:anthranilate synthase component I family protein [Mucilaginibacter robiniae]QJD94801.1 anthranilate synthase component I family protein [Mucilaginibacter robiniae]